MSKTAWQISALIILFAVWSVWMPQRDAESQQTEKQAFYRDCMAKEGERVIVERHAGSWGCQERHQIMKFAQGGGK